MEFDPHEQIVLGPQVAPLGSKGFFNAEGAGAEGLPHVSQSCATRL